MRSRFIHSQQCHKDTRAGWHQRGLRWGEVKLTTPWEQTWRSWRMGDKTSGFLPSTGYGTLSVAETGCDNLAQAWDALSQESLVLAPGLGREGSSLEGLPSGAGSFQEHPGDSISGREEGYGSFQSQVCREPKLLPDFPMARTHGTTVPNSTRHSIVPNSRGCWEL